MTYLSPQSITSQHVANDMRIIRLKRELRIAEAEYQSTLNAGDELEAYGYHEKICDIECEILSVDNEIMWKAIGVKAV